VNGIHRIAFAVAGLATITGVGGVFAAQGYLEAQAQAQAAESARASALAAAEIAAWTPPPLTPEIVYVEPVPTPQIINVVQTAEPSAAPPIVRVTVPAAGDEHEDEHEHEDDD